MDYGKSAPKRQVLFEATVLWSDAFSFWPIWPFSCSSAVMILTFIYTHQYPAFVLINAAAR